MFSPYYASARRRDPKHVADPLDHCAINAALHGPNGSRWAMTERGRSQVHREAKRLRIGPSAMHWDGDALVIDLDERCVPWPVRLRGRVSVRMTHRLRHAVSLAPGHWWCPIAPVARVEVALDGHRWAGNGYLDSNQGSEPLERAFKRWDWSRAHLKGGDGAVFYDVERVDGSMTPIGLRFDANGGVTSIEAAPPTSRLADTGWRLERHARSDTGTPTRIVRTLTDAPFYARSLLESSWLGERVSVMHESLSLARFDTRVVQAMLPFRMPRRAG